MKTRFEAVVDQEAGLKKLRDLIASGSVNPRIVTAARAIAVAGCEDRDDACQVQAIFEAVKRGTRAVPWLRRGFRYVSDPRPFDTYATCDAIIEMCEQGANAGDCLPLDTLILREDYQLVPLHTVNVGDKIWGDGQWTAVTNRWDKGKKPLIELNLSNGASLRITGDHRVFRMKPNRPRSEAEEVHASELRPGDELLPGVLIASGKGGIGTSQLRAIGQHCRARPQALPFPLDFTQFEADALLQGIHGAAGMSSSGSVLQGALDRRLSAQLRVLYRMLGQSAYLRESGVEHKPLGIVKRADTEAVRVRSVTEAETAPVMDIETDSGRFWLPEADIVVHNCDEHTVLVGSMLAALGFQVGARAWGPEKNQNGEYVHVYAVCALPRNGWPKTGYSGHGVDTTERSSYVGWEPEGGHVMTAWLR